LDKEDCKFMISGLGGQISLTYDNETVDYIFEMSGGHPFLARQICSLAYKKHGDVGHMPFKTVQQVTDMYVRNPATASYFDDHGLWGELGQKSIWEKEVSEANHSVLRLIAASPKGLTKTELCAAPNGSAEQSFIALAERSIISPVPDSDCYQITFGLFRDWIRHHKLTGA